MSIMMSEVCDLEVSSMLRKQAICCAEYFSDCFVSSLFVACRKNRGCRPIIHFKNLNEFIRYEHFKFIPLSILYRPFDLFNKLDFKDAYFTVPVGEDF